VATIRATSHSAPIYLEYGVVHYGVPNIPAAVPRTSTFALANATLPYVRRLAALGVDEGAARDPSLAAGINVRGGEILYQGRARGLRGVAGCHWYLFGDAWCRD